MDPQKRIWERNEAAKSSVLRIQMILQPDDSMYPVSLISLQFKERANISTAAAELLCCSCARHVEQDAKDNQQP